MLCLGDSIRYDDPSLQRLFHTKGFVQRQIMNMFWPTGWRWRVGRCPQEGMNSSTTVNPPPQPGRVYPQPPQGEPDQDALPDIDHERGDDVLGHGLLHLLCRLNRHAFVPAHGQHFHQFPQKEIEQIEQGQDLGATSYKGRGRAKELHQEGGTANGVGAAGGAPLGSLNA
jgi:hypothetical protein